MTTIQTVSQDHATGEVAAVYEQIKNAWGHVPNAISLFSSNPFLLKHQWEYYGSIMQHPTLSPALTACIRMLVSEQGHCAYCIDMNAGMLMNMMGWSAEQVQATRASYLDSPLPEREKMLLGFVLKAVKDPTSTSAEDVGTLRALGWSDSDVLDALNHGARMVAGDILINAFQVERDF